MTSHPDHVKSLFTAKPGRTRRRSTGETPLRPILGPNSVLILLGERHMRERKLLLPPFHGEAVERYVVDDLGGRRARDRPLAGRAAVRARAADAGGDARRDHERPVRDRRDARARHARSTGCARRSAACCGSRRTSSGDSSSCTTSAARRRAGSMRVGARRRRPRSCTPRSARRATGPGRGRRPHRRAVAAAERARRGRPAADRPGDPRRADVARARRPRDDRELARVDVRAARPHAGRVRPAARAGPRRRPSAPPQYVEATIHEGMRVRPVIPMIVRMVKRPWRLGEYVVPADTPVAISIVALHHRPDVYPDPHAFRPERFVDSASPGDVHLDPVRRRHPALPRRVAGDGRAAGRARGDRAANRPGGDQALTRDGHDSAT